MSASQPREMLIPTPSLSGQISEMTYLVVDNDALDGSPLGSETLPSYKNGRPWKHVAREHSRPSLRGLVNNNNNNRHEEEQQQVQGAVFESFWHDDMTNADNQKKRR